MKIRHELFMQKVTDVEYASGGISPSAPDYNLSVADLRRVDISPEAVGRVIAQSTGAPGVEQLIAAMLKSQFRKNSAYRPHAFAYPIFTVQQVLTQNPLRNVLIIQNSGPNDILVVFEGADVNPVDMSAAGNQAKLNDLQTRALRIVSGGSFTPFVAPSNPVTLFTLNGATFGLVVDGQ